MDQGTVDTLVNSLLVLASYTLKERFFSSAGVGIVLVGVLMACAHAPFAANEYTFMSNIRSTEVGQTLGALRLKSAFGAFSGWCSPISLREGREAPKAQVQLK